jgi:hypothetical protein
MHGWLRCIWKSEKSALTRSRDSWAKEQAKTRPSKAWEKRWQNTPRHNLSAVALRNPPSTRPWKIFKEELDGRRDISCRLVQVITGHAFTGEYYRRFRPNDPTGCPCGFGPVQTREHIIRECPLHSHARHHLTKVSPTLSLPVILGSHAGLVALTKFLKDSSAFKKTSLPVALDYQDRQFGPG